MSPDAQTLAALQNGIDEFLATMEGIHITDDAHPIAPASLEPLDQAGIPTDPSTYRAHVDDNERRITFLYKLEDGVAEGSFGMHCAAMCGIPEKVINNAEDAAKQWEHTSRLTESLERRKRAANGDGKSGLIGLGWWSDVAWMLREDDESHGQVTELGLEVLCRAIEKM